MTEEKQIIDKAIELVNDWEIDKALDLIEANYKLLEKPWFMKHYIKKEQLKKYHIKDSQNGYEWQFEQLINDEWWKVSRIENNTIFIGKTGKDLIFDLENLKSIKSFN